VFLDQRKSISRLIVVRNLVRKSCANGNLRGKQIVYETSHSLHNNTSLVSSQSMIGISRSPAVVALIHYLVFKTNGQMDSQGFLPFIFVIVDAKCLGSFPFTYLRKICADSMSSIRSL